MEDSIFIEVLKFGEEKGIEGVSFEKLKNWIYDDKDAGFTDTELVLLKNIFDECFEQSKVGNYIEEFNLKTEYYFRLIEYRELQESREAAKSANRNAMWAICISILAIIISAVLTFNQLNTPVSMNKSDLQALINSNTKADVQREVKIDSLQMAQILSAIGYSQPHRKAEKQKALDQGREVSHHQLINKYFEGESGAILKE